VIPALLSSRLILELIATLYAEALHQQPSLTAWHNTCFQGLRRPGVPDGKYVIMNAPHVSAYQCRLLNDGLDHPG
jgi:hypothetical protein